MITVNVVFFGLVNTFLLHFFSLFKFMILSIVAFFLFSTLPSPPLRKMKTKNSFGDGVQFPVQIKHLPGNVGNASTNYESMGNSVSLNKFETIHIDESSDMRNNVVANQNGAIVEVKQTATHINIDDEDVVNSGPNGELAVLTSQNNANRPTHNNHVHL